MGLKSEAVDALIENVVNAQNKADLATSVKALIVLAGLLLLGVSGSTPIAWPIGTCTNIPKHCRPSHWVILISGGTMPKSRRP